MTTLINLEAVATMNINNIPFIWGVVEQTLVNTEIAIALQESFPTEGFKNIEQLDGLKKYLLCGATLARKEQVNVNSELWIRLIKEIQSTAYRQAIETCTGLSLKGLSIEVTAWRQRLGGFIGPHTDKQDKVITHLIYFSNPIWSSDMGGCLRILNTCNLDDVYCEIPPWLGYSVILVRSDNSWHGYRKILDVGIPRLSLQINFHHSELSYSHALK